MLTVATGVARNGIANIAVADIGVIITDHGAIIRIVARDVVKVGTIGRVEVGSAVKNDVAIIGVVAIDVINIEVAEIRVLRAVSFIGRVVIGSIVVDITHNDSQNG